MGGLQFECPIPLAGTLSFPVQPSFLTLCCLEIHMLPPPLNSKLFEDTEKGFYCLTSTMLGVLGLKGTGLTI